MKSRYNAFYREKRLLLMKTIDSIKIKWIDHLILDITIPLPIFLKDKSQEEDPAEGREKNSIEIFRSP